MEVQAKFDLFESCRGMALACPKCGCEDVHMIDVVVSQGHQKTTVSHKGTETEVSDRHKTHRGSEIAIDFQCEYGCDFRYAFEFHKGTTMVNLQVETGGNPGSINALWRD